MVPFSSWFQKVYSPHNSQEHYFSAIMPMRYHLTLARMGIIKKIIKNKCWWICGIKENSYSLLWRMWIGATTVENSMEVSQITKNRITIWFSDSTPGYISEKYYNTNSKNTCTSMFIAALFTIAKIWKHLVSINRWMARKAMEWIVSIYSNMNWLEGYYAKWNKSDRERQILHDFTYILNLKKYKKLVNNTKKQI